MADSERGAVRAGCAGGTRGLWTEEAPSGPCYCESQHRRRDPGQDRPATETCEDRTERTEEEEQKESLRQGKRPVIVIS